MVDNIYNPEFVKGLFNRMSTSYERVNYITSFGFSIRWRKQFLNSFQSNNYQIQVIDLLTGMGETWKGIKDKFPNSKLTALDFSEEMINSAKRKNEIGYNGDITLFQQDVLENRLPDDYFDIVICAFGLKTFNNAQLQILAIETKRILKTGGQFSFIEVSKPNLFFLNKLYSFYLGKVIPIFGKLLLGNPSEYKMLWIYTDKFKNAINATEIFNTQGLSAKYKSYFFGCATGFSGHKQ